MHHWFPPPMAGADELGLGAEDEGETETLLAWLTGAAGADAEAGAEDGAADDGAADAGAAYDAAAEDAGTAAAGADEDSAADDGAAEDWAAEDAGTAAAGADEDGAATVAIGVELVNGQTKTSEVFVMVMVVSGWVYVPAGKLAGVG